MPRYIGTVDITIQLPAENAMSKPYAAQWAYPDILEHDWVYTKYLSTLYRNSRLTSDSGGLLSSSKVGITTTRPDEYSYPR